MKYLCIILGIIGIVVGSIATPLAIVNRLDADVIGGCALWAISGVVLLYVGLDT